MTVIVPNHTLSRVFIGLHGGCVVFCAILFLVLWDCIDLKHKRIASSNIKHYSIIAISMYAISSIIMLIYFILLPQHIIDPGHISDHLFQMSWGIFWRLGQAFLYLLFLERLKHSFQNTKYASSNKTFCIFYIGISIFLLSYTIKTSIYIYLYNHNHDEATDSLYAIVGDIDMGITQIIDLLLSIGIMTLFLNKLYKLNVDLTDINFLNGGSSYNSHINNNNYHHHHHHHHIMSHSVSINASSHHQSQSHSQHRRQIKRKLSLNQRQKSVIGIMAKITLLSGIALASSQIVLFLGGALYLSELIPNYQQYSYTLWAIKMGYFSINAVIISGSIALSFDFSYKWYKNFCNRIDKICVKCCTWSTKKKITKISCSSIDRLDHNLLNSNISSNLSSPDYNSGYNIAADNDHYGY